MATAAPKSRVILQQCLSAKLQVQPATGDIEAVFVEINRGLVIYLCFLKGADEEVVEKLVKTVMNVRLSAGVDGKLVSVLDLPGDVLIVPQATLGGTLKGKLMQYHKNIDKETGRNLYDNFVKLCSEQLSKFPQSSEQGKVVKSGTYGNLQVLRLDTNGPYSHLIEL